MNSIIFNREIYPRKIIEYTAYIFKNLCEIDITESDCDFICRFKSLSEINEIKVIREFENYMIDYINSEKLYADN
ncbi:MAG TPA: hypothetical protein DCG30_07755 [Ruminococcus sp.]|nr:hypothetical protein [Ruminococcus sp.]